MTPITIPGGTLPDPDEVQRGNMPAEGRHLFLITEVVEEDVDMDTGERIPRTGRDGVTPEFLVVMRVIDTSDPDEGKHIRDFYPVKPPNPAQGYKGTLWRISILARACGQDHSEVDGVIDVQQYVGKVVCAELRNETFDNKTRLKVNAFSLRAPTEDELMNVPPEEELKQIIRDETLPI